MSTPFSPTTLVRAEKEARRPYSIRRALIKLLALDSVDGLPETQAEAVAQNMIDIAKQPEDPRAAVAAAALIVTHTEMPLVREGSVEVRPDHTVILRGASAVAPALPEGLEEENSDAVAEETEE